MIGLIYLLSSFFFGFFLVSVFLKSVKGLAKLAASYLIGVFCFTWLTFVLSLVFSFSDDPMRWGVVGSLAVFLVALLLFKGRIKGRVKGLSFKGVSFLEFPSLIFTLVFSFWLMGKSFGYDDGYFRIASNIFDDFNIHSSIIRSFSLGKNFPPGLPFFAGQPLKYHFLADFCFAIFEYLGWRIDWAVNLPSALAFTSLLILIYSLAKKIFASALVGFLSVILFLFNSSLTFVKFFRQFGFSWQTPRQIWQLGEYLSAGPFDGGVISIFWNLNTFVNQRHLVFGLGIFLLIVWATLDINKRDREYRGGRGRLILTGVLVGLLPLWHGLIFLAAVVVVFGIWGIYRSWWLIAAILALPQLFFLRGGGGLLPPVKIGFLVAENLTLANFLRYWFFNLGLSCFFIPAGFLLADSKRKKIYLPFLALFILANLFQFSQNLFHNHSLLNTWIIISNIYSAYFLVSLFKKRGWRRKLLALGLLGVLGFSGVFDLMVIKNDFLHQIPDYSQDKLMTWIKNQTSTEAVFLAEERLYHPINLAGRKVFLGASHFVWGYGYDIDPRKILTNKIARSDNKEEIVGLLRESGADYWLTNEKGFDLPIVYRNGGEILYEIEN